MSRADRSLSNGRAPRCRRGRILPRDGRGSRSRPFVDVAVVLGSPVTPTRGESPHAIGQPSGSGAPHRGRRPLWAAALFHTAPSWTWSEGHLVPRRGARSRPPLADSPLAPAERLLQLNTGQRRPPLGSWVSPPFQQAPSGWFGVAGSATGSPSPGVGPRTFSKKKL